MTRARFAVHLCHPERSGGSAAAQSKEPGRRASVSMIAFLVVSLLSGCAVGPKYQRATAPVPAAWKAEAPWQVAAPKDAIPKGAWWKIFNDADLDAYETQLVAQNQSLAAARHRLEEARSVARLATAPFFPQLAADPGAVRQRVSANRPVAGAVAPTTAISQSVFQAPFAISYEADLFGEVRRNLEAANASLQSTAASEQNVQLVLTSELAADYFQLRELDAEIQVLEQSTSYQQKALNLVDNRHRGGVASGLEVAQQAALLESTRTQLWLLRRERAQQEHAMAVLTGSPASTFSVAVAALSAAAPAIPPGVPSDVLERRPDVAAAERAMAFENAQVGLATAAFYPHITISGSGGLQSRDIGTLLSAPSAFWAIGADALQPIFRGGRNRATLAAARSAYNESVANYRESVLTAFQQVEDGISGLTYLAQAAATQRAAVDDAQRALEIANNRYVGGATTYLDVITAESTLLNNQRLATQILGQQLVTSVFLVKALGGGWDASQIQNEQVHPKPIQAIQQ